jgi:hypothetical protein
VRWSDLRNGEDWFYFLWLFIIPIVIDIIVIGLPMAYSIAKITKPTNVFIIYPFLIVLFVIEFGISNWIYNNTYLSFLKIGIGIMLFLIFFWKRLF